MAETGDIVALRIDVTELKRTEAALEEKRREYFSLLQILPDMIVRFDRNLSILFANDSYAQHVGATADAPAHVLVLHAPALDGYFRELAGLWSAGQPDAEAERALMRAHGMRPL